MNLYLVNKGPLIGSSVVSPSVRLSQHGPTAANPLLQVVGPGGMRYRSIAATAADECVVSRCQHMYTVSQKVSPLNILQQPPQTCTDLNEILHTHKTTSIFVIDVKFYKNPLFRLRDFQFFQTAVTNLSYRYYFFTTTAARSVTSTI